MSIEDKIKPEHSFLGIKSRFSNIDCKNFKKLFYIASKTEIKEKKYNEEYKKYLKKLSQNKMIYILEENFYDDSTETITFSETLFASHNKKTLEKIKKEIFKHWKLIGKEIKNKYTYSYWNLKIKKINLIK